MLAEYAELANAMLYEHKKEKRPVCYARYKPPESAKVQMNHRPYKLRTDKETDE